MKCLVCNTELQTDNKRSTTCSTNCRALKHRTSSADGFICVIQFTDSTTLVAIVRSNEFSVGCVELLRGRHVKNYWFSDKMKGAEALKVKSAIMEKFDKESTIPGWFKGNYEPIVKLVTEISQRKLSELMETEL